MAMEKHPHAVDGGRFGREGPTNPSAEAWLCVDRGLTTQISALRKEFCDSAVFLDKQIPFPLGKKEIIDGLFLTKIC